MECSHGERFPLEIFISRKKFLSSKVPHYIHSIGRASKQTRDGKGVYKAPAPHFKIYSLAPILLASLVVQVCRVLGSTVGSILETKLFPKKQTICNSSTTLL